MKRSADFMFFGEMNVHKICFVSPAMKMFPHIAFELAQSRPHLNL